MPDSRSGLGPIALARPDLGGDFVGAKITLDYADLRHARIYELCSVYYPQLPALFRPVLNVAPSPAQNLRQHSDHGENPGGYEEGF